MSELALGLAAVTIGCYVLKLAGLSIPAAVLEHPIAERITTLIPVGLLGALVAVQGFSTDDRVVIDARLPALVVAALCLRFRVPFLPMLVAAAVTAAAWRAVF